MVDQSENHELEVIEIKNEGEINPEEGVITVPPPEIEVIEEGPKNDDDNEANDIGEDSKLLNEDELKQM